VGERYAVSQGNCGSFSHTGDDRFGYDFATPTGTTIVATRAGLVLAFKEDSVDGNMGTDANYVTVLHDDGSLAMYAHLTHNGVTVALGDAVTQGQPIALSGNTGYSTASHLHYEVYAARGSSVSVPITFRNAATNDNGLREGDVVEALSF
jgi:murein DD-endopeptidase MepM/ murein hydrolase activator NlpD